MTSGYREDIDWLRAIAVLSVVAFHFETRGVYGGFVGVDIFFVISGYLITGIIQAEVARGDFSFARFYERRVRRLEILSPRANRRLPRRRDRPLGLFAHLV